MSLYACSELFSKHLFRIAVDKNICCCKQKVYVPSSKPTFTLSLSTFNIPISVRLPHTEECDKLAGCSIAVACLKG